MMCYVEVGYHLAAWCIPLAITIWPTIFHTDEHGLWQCVPSSFLPHFRCCPQSSILSILSLPLESTPTHQNGNGHRCWFGEDRWTYLFITCVTISWLYCIVVYCLALFKFRTRVYESGIHMHELPLPLHWIHSLFEIEC